MSEERRLVTVLFADVAGSTALGEHRDPEDVRALLARFYAIAKEVIGAHGGTLEKFIGDAVMAVFGLPQAHGDDAERALAAALELRDRVQTDSLLGPQLPIRLGVDTGEVVAARDRGAGDFLMTGDAVNTAARLQQAAEPWAILCGERTARAAVRRFSFGPPTAVEAKGKRQPIGARPLLGRAGFAAQTRVPLIGREADLAQLELAARRAFGERRPFLVSLIAPAGIGKTRLLEEFLERLPALAPQATVAIAQCLPYGQRLTYWPLRAVLFRLADVAEDAEPSAARDGLLSWLQATGVESSRRIGDLLAATIGLGETEAVDRAALFAAWRTAIGAASQRSPLVLVFEDLHWSSDSLLDLFEFVMQPRGDAPLLMIALARPELLDRRPAWGGGRRNYISLSLEPLSDGAVASLVEHMIGGSSREIVARVVARAEGNPFYAGEIVRSLMERVPSLGDVAAVERALATMPDTVHATILARLDLLPPEERRVVQVGAVFGRAFRATGVAAVEPALAPDAERATEGLVVKDLIRPSDTDRFAFRHILIQEVAYHTLPRAERARLHAAAGAWLESRATGREDAVAEIIAYHYREATTISPTHDASSGEGDLRRKAVAWLTRAADVATAAAALGEAARHLQRAIELAEAGDLPELYERLGYARGGDAAAEADLTALRLCREARRPADQELRLVASLLMRYTRFQGSIGARPSEEELSRLRAEGRALLQRAGDQRAVAAFLSAEAFVPFWHSNAGLEVPPSEVTEAEQSVRRGLEIAEGLDDARLRSAALDGLSSLAQERGAWEEARQWARQRLTFQDRLDLPERLDAYSMAAWASVHLGELTDADRVSAAGLALLQPGQAVAWALHLAAWRTYALTLLGRWDEALATGDRARALWLESGVLSAGYAVRGFIPALDVARGRRDEARTEAFREVLERILRSIDPDRFIVRTLLYLPGDLDALEEKVIRGFAFTHANQPEYVERTFSFSSDRGRRLSPDVVRPIVAFAGQYHYRILEAQARRALGVALGDPAELTRALTLFERTGAIPYAARVRCERAHITGDEAEMNAGLEVLDTLGDLDQLARYERASER